MLNFPNLELSPQSMEKAIENIIVRDKKLLGNIRESEQAMIEIALLEKSVRQKIGG